MQIAFSSDLYRLGTAGLSCYGFPMMPVYCALLRSSSRSSHVKLSLVLKVVPPFISMPQIVLVDNLSGIFPFSYAAHPEWCLFLSAWICHILLPLFGTRRRSTVACAVPVCGLCFSHSIVSFCPFPAQGAPFSKRMFLLWPVPCSPLGIL